MQQSNSSAMLVNTAGHMLTSNKLVEMTHMTNSVQIALVCMHMELAKINSAHN